MGRAVSGRVSVTIAAGCVWSRFSKMILEPRLPTAACACWSQGVSPLTFCVHANSRAARAFTHVTAVSCDQLGLGHTRRTRCGRATRARAARGGDFLRETRSRLH